MQGNCKFPLQCNLCSGFLMLQSTRNYAKLIYIISIFKPEPNGAETGHESPEYHPSEMPSPTLNADHVDDLGQVRGSESDDVREGSETDDVREGSETDNVSDSSQGTELNDAMQGVPQLAQGTSYQCDPTANSVQDRRRLEAEIPDPSRPRRACSDSVQLIASRSDQEVRNRALVRENVVLNRKNKILSQDLLALAAQNERLIQQQEAFVNQEPLMQNKALTADRVSSLVGHHA